MSAEFKRIPRKNMFYLFKYQLSDISKEFSICIKLNLIDHSLPRCFIWTLIATLSKTNLTYSSLQIRITNWICFKNQIQSKISQLLYLRLELGLESEVVKLDDSMDGKILRHSRDLYHNHHKNHHDILHNQL